MPWLSTQWHTGQVYTRYCELFPFVERRDKSAVLGMYQRVTDPYGVAAHGFWQWASRVDDAALCEVQRRILVVESCTPHGGQRGA